MAKALVISIFVYISGGRGPSISPENNEAAQTMEPAGTPQAIEYVQSKFWSKMMVKACCSYHPRVKGQAVAYHPASSCNWIHS